jgi:hypothetical protein
VTTGNDNNMTIPTVSSSPELSNSGQPDLSSFSGGSSALRNISMAKMEPVTTESLAELESKVPEPTTSSSSGGVGLLDFAKGFFIKKMT